MTRRTLIIIVASAILLAAIAVATFLYLRQVSPSADEPLTIPGSPVASTPVHSDAQQEFDDFMKRQEKLRAAAQQDDRIDIQGGGGVVSVKNFYPKSDFVIGTSEVILAQEPGFTISFDRDQQVFTILDYAVSAAEFGIIRARSEPYFLQLLDISADDACKLDVAHLVPSNAEEPAIGNTAYPFSSCE